MGAGVTRPAVVTSFAPKAGGGNALARLAPTVAPGRAADAPWVPQVRGNFPTLLASLGPAHSLPSPLSLFLESVSGALLSPSQAVAAAPPAAPAPVVVDTRAQEAAALPESVLPVGRAPLPPSVVALFAGQFGGVSATVAAPAAKTKGALPPTPAPRKSAPVKEAAATPLVAGPGFGPPSSTVKRAAVAAPSTGKPGVVVVAGTPAGTLGKPPRPPRSAAAPRVSEVVVGGAGASGADASGGLRRSPGKRSVSDAGT